MSRSSRRSARSPTLIGALVLVDDCHATGHLGEKGRGTPALTGAGARVDIVTGTFGKTLGGGMGGFVAAAQADRRPPAPAGASLSLLELARAARRRRRLEGARNRDSLRRPPGAARRPCAALPRRDRKGGIFGPARRNADHSGDARRSAARPGARPRARRARRLCGGLLLSCGAKGRGAHPHPDVGRAECGRTSTSPSRPSRTPGGRSASSESGVE